MNNFTYCYPVKVCFGDGVAKDSLKAELQKYGKNILFAYGGGAIKRVGIYDEIIAVLNECGKSVTEFSGIMSNPTYTKVQEGARLAKENKVDFIVVAVNRARKRLQTDIRRAAVSRKAYSMKVGNALRSQPCFNARQHGSSSRKG